jgi:hypothetical protein
MPPPVDPKLREREREALDKVVVRKFTADPRRIEPFATTKLSWDVTIPVDSPFDIDVELSGEPVQPIGSSSVALSSSRTFTLAARTEHEGRTLKQVKVTVDDAACQTKLLVRADDIVNVIKAELDLRFSGNSDFRLKDNGTAVSVGDETIGITVPLAIKVPSWFNADMAIGIKLAVRPGKPVSVTAPTVSVDVRWNLFEHLASLFCTAAVQKGMEKIAQAFLADIVAADLVPTVANSLSGKVTKFLDDLQKGDPLRRTWAPRLVKLSASGFTVTACPKPQQ